MLRSLPQITTVPLTPTRGSFADTSLTAVNDFTQTALNDVTLGDLARGTVNAYGRARLADFPRTTFTGLPLSPASISTSGSGRFGVSTPLSDFRADIQHSSNLTWGLSDAAVYFLQKLDVFRPPSMTPERFLTLVNQTILSARLTINWRSITPLNFMRALCARLGPLVEIAPVTIESIGEQMANTLEGPFPPFSDILDHISDVISEKLEYN